MSARDHTNDMLGWWRLLGVLRVDLAVRRRSGVMIWHQGRPIDDIPVGWLGYENAREADIYIRPARDLTAPVVFLDDVQQPMALAIARKYRALVVRTSPANCHVWLSTTKPLNEQERARAQRWLAPRVDADQRSTSGEHLGRLAGYRNWKRGGYWVGTTAISNHRPWAAHTSDPAIATTDRLEPASATSASSGQVDRSPSGQDWRLACSLIESGRPLLAVRQVILSRAVARGKRAPHRYANRTATRAMESTYDRRPTR